ncbi:hypothetical protein [Agromyces bauzanensis]|uniref:Uncharacterized protein n=1 Tax=Agromyces bauzanensis TaxID=1308924 RepID=A0A917UN12_9MICO|nr:hypothetical protein [Agromyces bauzanensis]GGJ69500.1 hypothetical protein GCM10011372_04150 [Agromyces bauzanensis]
MSDALRPGDPFEGEYTDSELPLSAELPKEEYEAVEEVLDENDLDDDDVEVVEIVEEDRDYPPAGRDTAL